MTSLPKFFRAAVIAVAGIAPVALAALGFLVHEAEGLWRARPPRVAKPAPP
jgi:hypothetical protein